MNFKSVFGKLLAKMLPLDSLLRVNSRHEPVSVSHTIDAASLHTILREAEGGDTRRLFSLYRDIVLQHGHSQSEFSKRKLAVLGNPVNFSPPDENDPADKSTLEIVRDEWTDLPGKREALTHLLDSSLYPVALVEKTFKPATKPGLRYQIKHLTPVPHHLLDFMEGRLRIRDVDDNGAPLESFHEPSPSRYMIHRGHLLTSIPDTWGGPMRAVLFWWLFATMDREWWGRFLERYGAPFMVGVHPDNDDATRRSLEHAFSAATRLFGLVIPEGARVEIEQANASSSGDAFGAFHEVANAEISKIIVGQTMTSEAKPQGIGGTQAEVHERVRGDVRDFDDAALGETLREQLFRQLVAINGLPGRPPLVAWPEPDHDNTAAAAELLKALPAAGLRVTDEGIGTLSQRFGLPLERAESPPASPPGRTAFAAAGDRATSRHDRALAANDTITEASAADLSRAFRDSFADIERIIRDSRSPDEMEASLRAFCARYRPGAEQTLLANALASHAANAA